MTSAWCGDRLFEAPPGVEGAAAPKPAAAKTFRSYDPDQVFLMPPSLNDWLPEDHPARFVSELVDENDKRLERPGLIVPGDKHGGRHVYDIDRITLEALGDS